LLGLQALLWAQGAVDRGADYDEGVYLASLDAMRHGQELGSEIFTSQLPGWYHLLQGASYVLGNSQGGIRAAMLLCALAGSVAAYAIGRSVAGRWGGLACAGVLTVAAPYPTFAGRISADLPAAALCLWALALACARSAAGRPTDVRLAGVGALAGAAVLVKLTAGLVAVPLVWLLARERARGRAFAIAAGAALVPLLLVVVAHRGALADLWHGAVTYHREARTEGGSVGGNARDLLGVLDLRTPFTWLVAAGAVGLALPSARLVRHHAWPLVAWAVATAAFLLVHQPLRDNHKVFLAVALSLPAALGVVALVQAFGTARVRAAAAGVAVLVVAAGFVQEWRRLERNRVPLPAEAGWAVDRVRRSSDPAELVVSDLQIVPYLAGRRVPGELVDTAVLRFDSGSLTPRELLAEIDRVDAPVVVAARAFRLYPAIMAGLQARFDEVEQHGDVTVYRRSGRAVG
jgi:hypothetical protein